MVRSLKLDWCVKWILFKDSCCYLFLCGLVYWTGGVQMSRFRIRTCLDSFESQTDKTWLQTKTNFSVSIRDFCVLKLCCAFAIFARWIRWIKHDRPDIVKSLWDDVKGKKFERVFRANWWLVELPMWLTDVFLLTIFGRWRGQCAYMLIPVWLMCGSRTW